MDPITATLGMDAAGSALAGTEAGAFTAGGAEAAIGAGTTGLSALIPSAGTLTAIGAGTSLLGTLTGAAGARRQASAQAAAAGYNAKIAAQNAALTGAEGEAKVGQSLASTRARIGATLASQGASGIDVNTGSNVDVRESEAKLGALDALTIRSNAAREAYGYSAQSQLDTAQAQNAQTAGQISSTASILGGVGSTASSLAKYLAKNSTTGDITGGF